jgi:signal transduction histidine kinase
VRRRLLVSTVLIALAAVLLLGVPLGVVGGRLLAESARSRLEREADRSAARLAQLRDAGRPIDAAALRAVAAPGHGLDVRLADGRVVVGGERIPATQGFRVAADGSAGFRSVFVVAPREERTERLGTVWLAVALLSFVAVVAAVVLALVQARRLAWPLERLAGRAAGVGHPGFAPSPARSGMVEIDAVERALAGADERITDLLGAEREFSANVSHQLRGPLTGLRLRLEELARLAGETPELGEEVAAAQVQADRLMETIHHLEQLARHREAVTAAADLAQVARAHAAPTWTPRFTAAGRTLIVRAPGHAPVGLAEEAIRQVIDVLLENSLTHGAGETVLTVTQEQDWSRLVVDDDGPGVPVGDRELVFRRRHSSAGGSGVGLALARDLARRGGGELSLQGGARFEAVLPVA